MKDRDDGDPNANSEHGTALEADAGVGFGRPPKQTRFQPGQSGNPKGRPRGAPGCAKIVKKVAGKMLTVVENGKPRRRSTLELVLLTLRSASFEGNVRAFREVHELLRRYGPQGPDGSGGYLLVPERLTAAEWVAKYGRTKGGNQGE